MLRSGVGQAEVDRAVAELHASFQSAAAGAGTRPSTDIIDSILGQVTANGVYTSPARDLAESEQDLKGLTADDVTRALRNLFRGGGPLIFVSSPQRVRGGEQAVKAAFLETEKLAPSESAPRVQRSLPTPWPYTDFGKPGVAVETEQVPDIGTTFVRFANGAGLTVRPSKLRLNEVLVSVKVGGGRLDLPKDRVTSTWAASAVVAGGLKAMSYTEMQRILAAKTYQVDFRVGEDGFIFTGETTPTDLNTQLQVLTAYLQGPGFRPEGFERARSRFAARLREASDNPAAVMQLRAPEILHDGDKRWVSPSAQDVQTANVEELSSLLAPIFARGAVDITIVGDIAADRAVQSVAATLGALPTRSEPRRLVGSGNAPHLPAATALPVRILGSAQASEEIASVIWPTHGRFPDIQEDVTLQLMSAIMEERLSGKLRRIGTAYVAQVGHASSKVFDYGYVQAFAQLPPDRSHQFYSAINEIVADLKANEVTPDDLARMRNPALEGLRKSQQTNEYWLSVLDDAQENRNKLDMARIFEAALRQVGPSDIVRAARKYLTEPQMIKLAIGS